MARAKTRLELKLPQSDKPVRPYYVEYRLLDLDVREVVGQFGALVNTNRNRSRVMNVSARIGDYKLDSSNFVSEDGIPWIYRSDRHGGNRPGLRFVAAGFVDCHGSGIQRSRRNILAQAGVFKQPGSRFGYRRFCPGAIRCSTWNR